MDKWVDLSKNKQLRNLNALKDHWLNDPDEFDSELSDEFGGFGPRKEGCGKLD